MKKIKYCFTFFISSLFFLSCKTEEPVVANTDRAFKTKNVVIVVMDGARYSECLGDVARQYIPHLDSITKNDGIVCTSFYNQGMTNTNSGHTAICTGVYENVENTGQEIPSFPGIFHYYMRFRQVASEKAWIITSKDKLEVLRNCKDLNWTSWCKASTDCGVGGLGTGFRTDSITYLRCMSVLNQYHPSLVLVNFKEPDASGHQSNWTGYLQGIKDVDGYVEKIWSYLQTDTAYKDKTTLIVTNDHGRHLDGHLNGFVSHGDDCEGCRHINFYAMGPDFKKGVVTSSNYEMIDISKTVADMLHFPIPTSRGKVMTELYE